MLELSRVLTAGRGPTTDRDKMEQLKRDDPGAVPNANWDPRRLWLLTYSELDRTGRHSVRALAAVAPKSVPMAYLSN